MSTEDITIYGLAGRGTLQFLSGQRTLHCGRMYRTREEAEAAMPAFIKSCTRADCPDEEALTQIDKDNAKFQITERVLVGMTAS